MSATSAHPIIFLSALGKGPYHESTYRYEDKTFVTRYAPVATAALVFDASERTRMAVRLLSTPEARANHLASIEREFREIGVREVCFHDVPEAARPHETAEIFRAIVENVPQDEPVRVAIDVTLGFRHLPFLYVAGLAYLVGLGSANVHGLYYGARELGNEAEGCPILDVTYFFELLQWYQALTALRETGRAQALAKTLRHHVGNLFTSGSGAPSHPRKLSSTLRDAMEALATPLACGLPLESAFAATRLVSALQAVAEAGADEGLLAAQTLADMVKDWAFSAAYKEKQAVPLTEEELRRQWAFIRWCFEHEDYVNCFEALREWVVNLVLFQKGQRSNWLDYDTQRKPAERFLHALSYRVTNNLGHCSAAQKALASTWDTISNKRNSLAHAGMRTAQVKVTRESVKKLLCQANALLQQLSEADVHLPGTHTVLLAALGRSPGPLFSALRHVKPDVLLVLTSREAQSRMDETLAAAGLNSLETVPIVVEDPYRAFRERPAVVQQCRPYLLMASELTVNLTGGTTALQYLVERIAEEAKRLGTSVRRFAVFDRRPRREQELHPFHLGEIEWIDEPPSNDSAPPAD